MADNSDDSMHCGWKFLIGTLALLTVAGSAYGVYIAFIAGPDVEYKLVIVSDLDKQTETEGEDVEKKWKSTLKIGDLKWDGNTWTSTWTGSNEHELSSKLNNGDTKKSPRGMELSELVFFTKKFLTFDDKTRVVYDLTKTDADAWKVTEVSEKTIKKPEWATVKDGVLYIGSTGDYKKQMTVQVRTKSGVLREEDWEPNFKAVWTAIENYYSNSAGALAPGKGWVKHEAVMWSSKRGRWYFLPRNVLHTPFNTKDAHAQAIHAETSSSNLMISCSDDFSDCKVQTVGDTNHPDRGFSSFKFVPDSNDAKVVALKTVEKYDPVTTKTTFKTYFTMFKLSDDYEGAATILVADQLISDDKKFGGINFLP
eukprot:121529_1